MPSSRRATHLSDQPLALASCTRIRTAADRRMVCRILAAGMIAIFLQSPGVAAAAGYRAGAYAQDVTPLKFPISLNGGGQDNPATMVHDPLHARCLVIANAQTTAAFVVVDSCMLPRELLDSAKQQATAKTGIPSSHILVSATHAHSCPTATAVFQSDPDPDYVMFLAEKIAAGIAKAHSRLEPARIGWAIGVNRSQLFNRRWISKGGELFENPFGQKVDWVRMNPGLQSPSVERSIGLIDPEVTLLAAQRLDGSPLAVLANYSLHYVGGVPGATISADYFGEFATRLGRRIAPQAGDSGSFVGIMSNGTSADVNNVDFSQAQLPTRAPYEQMAIVAESVAETAAAAYAQVRWLDDGPLAVEETEIELGVRKPSAEELTAARELLASLGSKPLTFPKEVYARESIKLVDYPETVVARLQAWQVGELGIVTTPCETFTETGLAIKAASPIRPTMTISLANGYNGYLPTSGQHALGGYETWRARSSYLATNAEPQIRQTLLEMLDRVAKR